MPLFAGILAGIALGTMPLAIPGLPQPLRLGLAGGPNQVVIASARPRIVPSPTQATYPSGRINTAGGKLEGDCDKPGSYRNVPYSADYVFLRKS